MPLEPAEQDPPRARTSTPRDGAMTLSSVRTVYRRLAPVYDWVFNGIFQPGRQLAIERLGARRGDRVLEVGVGTGLALKYWPSSVHVTGIDLSPHMLARAERIRTKRRLSHVTLRVMDAQAMDFPDDSFEVVAAMYVVSVAPDLGALLNEIQRVAVPGARICIVNHFQQKHGLMHRIERGLSAHARFLGWDAALPIEAITRQPGLRVRKVSRVNLGGYWSLIEAENVK